MGQEFLRTGRLPEGSYRWGQSQRRPEDGQRNEEPVDPREVVVQLRSHGVEARARPHFGYNRSRYLGFANQAAARFGDFSLRFCGCYLVIGTKTEA